jgi:hypothetical protein
MKDELSTRWKLQHTIPGQSRTKSVDIAGKGLLLCKILAAQAPQRGARCDWQLSPDLCNNGHGRPVVGIAKQASQDSRASSVQGDAHFNEKVTTHSMQVHLLEITDGNHQLELNENDRMA